MTCLVCSATGVETVAEVDTPHGRFRVERCKACRFEDVEPKPRAEILASFYDEAYYRDGYLSRQSARMAESAQRARRVADALPEGGRILDVGCGTGGFLLALDPVRWQRSGIEPSVFAAKIARDAGLEIRVGTIETGAASGASFDVVTMFDVLGHVEDPAATLRAAAARLSPGGTLIVQVPNFRSPWHRFNMWLSRRRGVNRLHVPTILWRFDRRTLGRLIEAHGFDVFRWDAATPPSPPESWRLRWIRRGATAWGNLAREPQEVILYARRR